MKVGFIGLGRMGGHMASNVIKAGFETYVSDLVPALVEQKVAEGAIGFANNLEVAANMDIGFTMLPNGAIVEAVMCGPNGVLAHCKPGTIIVDMSSVSSTTTQKMAKKAAEYGVKYMDAPVSGGTIGAKNGTLTIMCGADEETFEAIERNKQRIEIVSKERIIVELNKILLSPVPSMGFDLLEASGLLKLIFPEVHNLCGVDRVGNHAHKDNFRHTLKVLDNVARRSDDLWLRWAALLHDIAKPLTKAYDPRIGWTFHQHEVLGSKMVRDIFRRMKLPLNEPMKFVQKMVYLHLRPIILSEDMVTDSAVRRLLFEAGDDVESLMTLCEADITSGIDAKVKRYMANFELVRHKMKDLEERDRVRNFQPPITGDVIMRCYDIAPCNTIGEIKEVIKNAILDGDISNTYAEAYALMEREAAARGLTKVRDVAEGE